MLSRAARRVAKQSVVDTAPVGAVLGRCGTRLSEGDRDHAQPVSACRLNGGMRAGCSERARQPQTQDCARLIPAAPRKTPAALFLHLPCWLVHPGSGRRACGSVSTPALSLLGRSSGEGGFCGSWGLTVTSAPKTRECWEARVSALLLPEEGSGTGFSDSLHETHVESPDLAVTSRDLASPLPDACSWRGLWAPVLRRGRAVGHQQRTLLVSRESL